MLQCHDARTKAANTNLPPSGRSFAGLQFTRGWLRPCADDGSPNCLTARTGPRQANRENPKMTPRKVLEEAYPLTRRARRWSTVLGIGTMTAALAWATAAGAAGPSSTLGPLVQITGTSPFNGCTADDPSGQE